MKTQSKHDDWTVSQLLAAAGSFTYFDGKADIAETRALIGLLHPFAEDIPELGELEKLLIEIAADGVVTAEESELLAASIEDLRLRFRDAGAVRDARKLGLPKMGLLGVQHMFAMFGATILVPILTGLSPSATLLWAGMGTLLFHLLTKRAVPAFLGSSFAYLAGYFALAGHPGTPDFHPEMLPYACLGVVASSAIYFIVAGFVKVCGVKRVMKYFPPIVTGPIIIGIGLVLAPVAVNSCTANWPVAATAMAAVLFFSIWGRGMFKIIPILMGVVISYLVAWPLGALGDFSSVASAAWIGLPVKMSNTVFPIFSSPDWGKIVSAVAIVFPLAFATIMEHVGDVSAISSTVGRNFFANPGLHRTMLGDGLATLLASLFGAPANTTYGENTGVLSLTKVYDPRVIRIAACLAILLSFCPKFSAFIGTIPGATIGGVSFVLYGMISAVGVRNLVESRVDLGKSRNMLIAAFTLVMTLGISFSGAKAVSFHVGGLAISLSGLAVGALTGIILNAILPGKDYIFSETAPTIKDADRFGGVKPEAKQ